MFEEKRMSFEEFVKKVQEKIFDYLPAQYQDYETIINDFERERRHYTSLALVPKNSDDDSAVGELLNLDKMHCLYVRDGFEKAMAESIKQLLKVMDERGPAATEMVRILSDKDYVRKHVYARLVPMRGNESFLSSVYFLPFFDMAIIYEIPLFTIGGQTGVCTVTTDFIQRMFSEISQQELFCLAVKNAKRENPPVIVDAMEIVSQMEIADFNNHMFAVTNASHTEGAVAMLMEDMLYELAESLDDNLYILPLSVNEFALLRADGVNENMVLDMVSETQTPFFMGPHGDLTKAVILYDRTSRSYKLVGGEEEQEVFLPCA